MAQSRPICLFLIYRARTHTQNRQLEDCELQCAEFVKKHIVLELKTAPLNHPNLVKWVEVSIFSHYCSSLGGHASF